MNFRPCFPRQTVAEQFHFRPLNVVVGSGLNSFHPDLKTSHLAAVTASPLVSQPQTVLTPLHWSRKCAFQVSGTLCLLAFLSHSLQGPAQAPLHPDHPNPQGPFPALKLGVPCLCFSDNLLHWSVALYCCWSLLKWSWFASPCYHFPESGTLCVHKWCLCWAFSKVSDFFLTSPLNLHSTHMIHLL